MVFTPHPKFAAAELPPLRKHHLLHTVPGRRQQIRRPPVAHDIVPYRHCRLLSFLGGVSTFHVATKTPPTFIVSSGGQTDARNIHLTQTPGPRSPPPPFFL